MYSLLDVDGKEIKTRKGINTVVVENIKHKEYPNVLINKKIMRHKIKRIQSKLHKIGTYDVYKIFSCFDDKRYILDDGIKNFAYYNKDIRSQQNWTKLMKLMKSSKVNKVNLIKLIYGHNSLLSLFQ